MRDKVLQAWRAFQVYSRSKDGVKRVYRQANAVATGVSNGVGVVAAAKDLSVNGPSKEDFGNVAWKVAQKGYREARVAYRESIDKIHENES
jgi:hypothetical protein